MKFILMVYLITPDSSKLVTAINGFTSIEKCFKASQSITVSPGPAKLAFNCEKK